MANEHFPVIYNKNLKEVCWPLELKNLEKRQKNTNKKIENKKQVSSKKNTGIRDV